MLVRDFWAQRTPTTGVGSTTITPDDTNDLVNPVSGQKEIALSVFTEAAGTVAFVSPDGTTDSWTVTAPAKIPVPMRRVKSTGTTPALVIHAIW